MARVSVERMLAQGMGISRGGSAAIMQRVAICGIAISVAVMIVASVVVSGFKKEIASKVETFVAHYEILSNQNYSGYEEIAISSNAPFVEKLKESKLVESISPYAIKAGVASNGDAIEGIILKGVDSLYNLQTFKNFLVDGKLPILNGNRAKEILISKSLARALEAKVGDKLKMLFIAEPIRRDAFTVSGIYDTQLEEFDKMTAIVDIRNIQRLNGWSADMVTGLELIAPMGFDSSPQEQSAIEDIVYKNESYQNPVVVESMRDKYSAIFEWLDLQDINIVIISTIMLVVAIFNMIAMMLILLIERTSTIGILKSVGMSNGALQRLFMLRAIPIASKGILWANVIAISLALIQKHFEILKLNGDGYFLTVVPIDINWVTIVAINIISIVVIVISQVIPTLVISHISPHKAVKYE